jgi:hypothetical protein
MKLAGLFLPRFAVHALAARSPIDIALFGVGVSSAAASVVFAAVMFSRAGDAPMVNGLQYLGVFGAPHGHSAVVASAEPARAATAKVADAKVATPARADARQSIDMSPTGSIVRGGEDGAPVADPYHLVAVESGIAWLHNSVETRVIKTGDVAPGLGRIAAIVRRDGRWTLLDDSGAVVLTADLPAAGGTTVNPFSRRMIFGGE